LNIVVSDRQLSTRGAMEEEGARRCPRCGGQLELVNVIQRFGDRLEVRMLQCTTCKELQLLTVNGYEHGRPAGKTP
jgi:DNA-directed RNA polymerase subunit M/transcription elongation factor TFIIS